MRDQHKEEASLERPTVSSIEGLEVVIPIHRDKWADPISIPDRLQTGKNIDPVNRASGNSASPLKPNIGAGQFPS